MDERRTCISSLKFLNYTVNKVNFTANNVQDKKDGWKLSFDIKNTTRINAEKNKMSITLAVGVFKGIEDAPFYIDAEIVGYFELEGEDNIIRYEANAIAIMYPYLRAIISTYTSAANVAPVILPAINVNAMLKRKREQDQKQLKD